MKEIKLQIKKLLADIPVDFGGGCSIEKATTFAWLIKKLKINKSIDIGVYKGRSFLPQAYAHKTFTGGYCFGVDPYLNSNANQSEAPINKSDVNAFVNATSFDQLYIDILDRLKFKKLTEHGGIIRKPSLEAVSELEKLHQGNFGLIHIDGNHDSHFVLMDVKGYLPLLSKGGVIVLDDVSWDSVKPAVEYISSKLSHVITHSDSKNDFSIFIDSNSWFMITYLRLRLTGFYFPGIKSSIKRLLFKRSEKRN
jgi:hypothetical protein